MKGKIKRNQEKKTKINKLNEMDLKRSRLRVEQLDVEDVLFLIKKEGFGEEFQQFVKEKKLDGLKLLGVTEGILKLWRPKLNAKRFLHFIDDLRKNPNKYLDSTTTHADADLEYIDKEAIKGIKVASSIECQYQTVSVKRIREEVFTTTSRTTVEDILNKLVPTRSFLYPNQNEKKTQDKAILSYVPMDVGKKPRRFFSFSYDSQHFDLRKFKFYKSEKFNDRGYYAIKATAENENKNKQYKNIDAVANDFTVINDRDSIEIVVEDHFYEDLCYNDSKDDKVRERSSSLDHANKTQRFTKIHDLFNTIKFPFLKKGEEIFKRKDKEGEAKENKKKEGYKEESKDKLPVEEVKNAVDYENASECCSNMYDSVQLRSIEKNKVDDSNAAVTEYLEPIRIEKDYCDITLAKSKDDSFLGFIMSIFGSHFGLGRETTDPSEDSEADQSRSPIQKWSEHRKSRGGNMADRPLPVPVDNEPYYMNIDRAEAEALLAGQPDGTFILRPSSQPNHVYTLTIACSNDVHNVGVRRRPDGRLALGFPRRGERCFTTISSLLRYHRRRRLLLVAAQGVVGATTLKEPPVYYQTPSSLPVHCVARPSSVL